MYIKPTAAIALLFVLQQLILTDSQSGEVSQGPPFPPQESQSPLLLQVRHFQQLDRAGRQFIHRSQRRNRNSPRPHLLLILVAKESSSTRCARASNSHNLVSEPWVAYPLRFLQRVYPPWRVGAFTPIRPLVSAYRTSDVPQYVAQLWTSTLIRTAG